jgi:hypothetical protein
VACKQEDVESTVAAWAAAAAPAPAPAAVRKTEAAAGQSSEGTGTAWVGESIGVARAARVARAEAVGPVTRMRAATGVVGTKGT